MKTYLFRIQLQREDDGRWSAGIPVLLGCASWGSTRDEAVQNLRDAAEAYVRDMGKAGEPIPVEPGPVDVIDTLAVAVTV